MKCKIDTTLYSMSDMHNGFELDRIFNIFEQQTEPNYIHKVLVKLLRRFKPASLVYADKPYQYCESVFQTKKKYLIGDWINVQYFDRIRDLIEKNYIFQNISARNYETAGIMQARNSVSLHIRRGDYLNLPYYCVCDDKYYESAITYIKAEVEDPIFYIFSNEPDWCANFMKKFGVKFKVVDWNQGVDSYQDMYLMTQCKHNIIANSTFSWWGAWLNENSQKLVIAPQKWFKTNDNNANCIDWHLVEIN